MPFSPYQEYSKEEAGAVVGLRYGAPAWRKGIFWFGPRENMLLFVTLVKDDLPFEYSYSDRFLSPEFFQWESQRQNSSEGEVARKVISHERDDRDIHLFVRARAGHRFLYVGRLHFLDWSGDRPFKVWWRLENPLPAAYHVSLAVPPAQDGRTPVDIGFPELLPDEVEVAREIETGIQAGNYTITESYGIVGRRIGSKMFRHAVLENFGGACCVDGLNVRDLLDAAHIQPWSTMPQARLDPKNGLALCALHHRAFDSGLMHFLRGGVIAIAEPVRVSNNPSTIAHLISYHQCEIRRPVKFPTILHL